MLEVTGTFFSSDWAPSRPTPAHSLSTQHRETEDPLAAVSDGDRVPVRESEAVSVGVALRVAESEGVPVAGGPPRSVCARDTCSFPGNWRGVDSEPNRHRQKRGWVGGAVLPALPDGR